jgi:hypothetical protein
MRFNLSSLLLIAAALLAVPAARAQLPTQSIIENGNFDNPTDPLKGWVTDYAWAGNSNYMGNKDHITAGTDGSRKVAKFGDAGNAGVKMESRAFPLEPGYKYTCTLDIKSGGYRIYLAGYQWAPGTHPHDKPELGELRMVYQSKTSQGASEAWKHEKMELPGITLSSAAIEHLKKVRFLTVYIYMLKPGAVSNVVVTKTPDPTMKFE